MYYSFEVAAYFADKFERDNGVTRYTNYQLVKMVVDAKLQWLRRTGRDLFIEPISIERFGPVVDGLGKDGADFSQIKLSPDKFDAQTKETLDAVYGEWRLTNDEKEVYDKTHDNNSLFCYMNGKTGAVSEKDLRLYVAQR